MITEVAVGVVFRDDGAVLIGQRLQGKPYAGWWEFPGGKFEPGEDAAQALVRELDEELGIEVLASGPWVVREHVYQHAHVRLHFRRVVGWRGTVRSREGQAFVWQQRRSHIPAAGQARRSARSPPAKAASRRSPTAAATRKPAPHAT